MHVYAPVGVLLHAMTHGCDPAITYRHPKHLTNLFHINSRIGAVGFARAIEAGWGEYLLEKLAPSYRAKFGRDPVLGRNKAGDQARAQARKATLGVCTLRHYWVALPHSR